MGFFLSYLIQVSLIMAVLFLCYKVLLASSTFHAFKRFTVLALLVFSWLLPLAVTPLHDILANASATEAAATGARGEVAIAIGTPIAVGIEDAHAIRPQAWQWLMPVYVGGLVCLMLFTLMSILKLARLIHTGEKRHVSALTMILNSKAAGPFSWGKYIVMRPEDCGDDFSLIMAHELRHIKHMHWLDTLVAQINLVLLWFNPISYMLMRELKAIHEFEADRAIPVAQAHRYQLMLIKKAVGSSFPTFANSLYHSQIKKRITMMMKRKSSAHRLLTALALPGAAAMAVLALSQPTVAQILADVRASSCEQVSNSKGNQNFSDEQIAGVAEAVNTPAHVSVESAAKAPDDPQSDMPTVVLLDDVTCVSYSEAQSSAPKEEKPQQPAYFVDGKLFVGNLTDLNPQDIKSMTVVKNDPAYPQGKIMIELMSESDKVPVAASKTAEFKGGMADLHKFLMENIKYPVGLKGKVTSVVQFTIDKDGAVGDYKVMRSGGEAADAEAIRVISLTSNKWVPAQNDGQPTAIRYVLPITFSEVK